MKLTRKIINWMLVPENALFVQYGFTMFLLGFVLCLCATIP